jgi:hypothetical protein
MPNRTHDGIVPLTLKINHTEGRIAMGHTNPKVQNVPIGPPSLSEFIQLLAHLGCQANCT